MVPVPGVVEVVLEEDRRSLRLLDPRVAVSPDIEARVEPPTPVDLREAAARNLLRTPAAATEARVPKVLPTLVVSPEAAAQPGRWAAAHAIPALILTMKTTVHVRIHLPPSHRRKIHSIS